MLTTDILPANTKSKQQRLADGWAAQCGAVNPSGLIYSLINHVHGCINENVLAQEDTGVGLVVHQLMFLQRDTYGHESASYDAWVRAVKDARARRPSTSTNEDLLRLLMKMRTRCHIIRDGVSFGTWQLREDPELTALTLTLYTCTRADWLDSDSSAYSAAYDLSKAAYEATRS